MIILYLILIALGAVAYRLGGASYADFPKLPKWLIHSYTRDIGIPLIALASMAVLHKYHWSLWLCMPLMYGACTTYWKILNQYFGDTTEDCHWYNYAAHGLMLGLALIPYAIYTDTLVMVICRAILMGIIMPVWCEVFKNVNVSECGRGAIIEGTLWML